MSVKITGLDKMQKQLKEVERATEALNGSYDVHFDANCSGQQKLATALEFFPYRFSDSFGGNPPLYSCGLSAL